MKILNEIDKEELLKDYLEKNQRIKGPDYHSLRRILQKDNVCCSISLNPEEIENIILPHHFFCNCNHKINLKGIIYQRFGGLTLDEATQGIKSKKTYPKKYPVC
jgi:hypothetical protein